MTTPVALAALLALVVLVASARLLWQALRLPSGLRPAPWRTAALLLLQAGSAVLLYFALLPPTRPVDAGTLVVLTAGADAVEARRDGARVVALPEADAMVDAVRVPDLATALRRFPGHDRLQVIGAGLVARDRDAVAGRALVHAAPPLPRGIVALAAPPEVAEGGGFAVGGGVHGVAGGSAELLDPAGRRVDHAALDDDGGFRLAGRVGTAGAATFVLRIRDARGGVVEAAPLPLQVRAPRAQRLLLLGGAPGPELKYLRRWASDAGLAVHAQFGAGGGVQLGDRPLPVDAATLAGFDAVVVDERALQSLGEASMAALRAQVDAGLGLVVRVGGPLSAGGRARLATLGVTLRDAGLSSQVLPQAEAALAPGADGARPPLLTRRPVRAEAGDGIATLRAADGEPLALRRNLGRGRVTVLTVGDSFRWVLAGHGDRHARLWSALLADTARAAEARAPTLPRDARVGTRAAVCGLSPGATLEDPRGATVPLLVDPTTGVAACAGAWPDVAGWHHVVADGGRWPLYVRDAAALPGVTARELRQATARLSASGGDHVASATAVPGPRWPWWLAWLVASGLSWWLERSRVGRAMAVDVATGPAPGTPARAGR